MPALCLDSAVRALIESIHATHYTLLLFSVLTVYRHAPVLPTKYPLCHLAENMVPAKRLKARESMATQLKPKPKIDPSHWSRRLTTATTKHTVPKAPLRTATTNKDEVQ